jgi:zinc transporter ZupT
MRTWSCNPIVGVLDQRGSSDELQTQWCLLHKLVTILFLFAFSWGITANTARLSAGWSGFGFGLDEPGSKAVLAIPPSTASELHPSNRSLSRTQMGILLGIGLVGLIALSRRKSSAIPKKHNKK